MDFPKISVTVKLFASVKDIARVSEATLELPAASVAGDVVSHFVSQFPALEGLRSYVRVAVNECYVDVSHPLHDGDDVALIPPVSGG